MSENSDFGLYDSKISAPKLLKILQPRLNQCDLKKISHSLTPYRRTLLRQVKLKSEELFS